MMQNSAINHTAVHEAGHAIIAADLGGIVNIATIVPNASGSMSGYVRHQFADPIVKGKKGERRSTIGFAGFWAECIFFGHCNGGAHGDFRKAARITGSVIDGYQYRHAAIFGVNPDTWGDHYIPRSSFPTGHFTPAWQKAWARAEQLCVQRRTAIECLAESLLVCRTLEPPHTMAAVNVAFAGLVYDTTRDATHTHIHIRDLTAYRAAQGKGLPL